MFTKKPISIFLVVFLVILTQSHKQSAAAFEVGAHDEVEPPQHKPHRHHRKSKKKKYLNPENEQEQSQSQSQSQSQLGGNQQQSQSQYQQQGQGQGQGQGQEQEQGQGQGQGQRQAQSQYQQQQGNQPPKYQHQQNPPPANQYQQGNRNPKRQRGSKQLESSGGGFNANINQNNEFSPNFGNLGSIGAIGGRSFLQNLHNQGAFGGSLGGLLSANPDVGDPEYVDGRGRGSYGAANSKIESYLENLTEDDIAKFLYYAITSLVNSADLKHKGSTQGHKPEYFFDFRQIYMPTDDSSSSSESQADDSIEKDVFGKRRNG